MDIEIQNATRTTIVNCLFNPNDTWQLHLNYAKMLDETEDQPIENAIIEIHSGSDDPIKLHHNQEGIYTANKYPVAGKEYTLKINIPGQKQITAQSSIPKLIEAQITLSDINWRKYIHSNDLLDYYVFPLTVDFQQNLENANCIFRAHSFDPRYGYNRYMLTSANIETLKKEGLPVDVASKLEQHADIWLSDRYYFTPFIKNLDRKFYLLILDLMKEKKLNHREYESFQHCECFADDTWINNISYDTYTVIGESNSIKSAKLLFGDLNLYSNMEENNPQKIEKWIEVTCTDINYIEYFKSYILQVNQRTNPYSEPIKVYSNIKNGAGIFAGFNRQMIHIFTY